MTVKATAVANHSAPPLCDEQGPIPTFPPIPTDPATGRPLPISDEERAARRAAAIRVLDVLASGQITDETDTDERWEEIYRSIDASRPHRPLFEGMY